ncbi:S8 family serine peptidase [Actinosynnema pretiosum subsp. pretiosum]
MITAGLVAAPMAPVALGAPSGAPEPEGATGEVTLVTGDRVRLENGRVRALLPGPGRAEVGAERFERDGHAYVIPADAAPAVAGGKLDLRLFDVTALVESGYDDARRDSVPLIVTHRDGGAAARRTSGLRVTSDLPAVRSFAARSPKADAGEVFQALVSDPAVEKVWLDGLRKPALDRSTAQIGAPAAWQAGLTGAGVKVAVLDSGVDGAHPDLVGRVSAEADFTDEADSTDTVGHGTHVAATIASTDERYRGVAPDAEILAGKVCTTWGCPDSAILAGMQWAVDQGADVVNLSLGGPDAPGVDPLEGAVDALSAGDGPLFVVAAGNDWLDGSVNSPGSADAALTVGAVDREDALADFSSRGPRLDDGAVKPDLTAPGVDVVAAKAAAGVIGTPVDEDHVAMSGTSMATPHVAGAAALLKQQHPDWNGQRIKATLMASAKHNPALTPYEQGVGRVDLAAAITADVIAEPSSVALGSQAWPHDDDVPVTRELTYRNSGSAPVTLDLSVETTAPSGMFTVSPAQLTISSGGTGTATVTGDPRVGTADGSFSAWVVAGSGPRVPVGLNRGEEVHDVTFETLGLDGAPHPDGTISILGMSNSTHHYLALSESTTVTLPPGHYLVGTAFYRPSGSITASVVRPDLVVTGPATVTTDLRTAPLVDVDLPDPSARLDFASTGTNHWFDGVRYGYGTSMIGEGLRFAQVGQAPPEGALKTLFEHEYGADPVDGAEARYRLAWVEDGLVDAVDRTFTAQDLAEVRTEFGPAPAGVGFWHGAYARAGGLGSGILLRPVPPSGQVVDRVNTEARWDWEHWQGQRGSERRYVTGQREYQPGKTYRERMGTPVHGPSGRVSATRTGDSIEVDVPLFDDAQGNYGSSQFKSARTALHRDGVLVGETEDAGHGRFEVAPGEAEFRVEASYERDSVLEFGSALSASWTFRSGTTATPTALPLGVVRFAPELDRAGTAPPGPFAVPLDATRPFATTTADASFDDGATWTAVPVVNGVATVPNPASGWVSLRVAAESADGTAFGQTAIRAYRIG